LQGKLLAKVNRLIFTILYGKLKIGEVFKAISLKIRKTLVNNSKIRMNQEKFAVALSEKNQDEAIKEVSLKIKTIFPKDINFLIILFTPGYNPANIIRSSNLTLKPKKLLGLQAPSLIFGGRIIQKGLIACCVNKENVSSKEVILKKANSQEIETLLRFSFQRTHKENMFLLSLLNPSLSPSSYLNAFRLSLGSAFAQLGVGYKNQYSQHTYQILDKTISEDSVSIIIEGIRLRSLKLGGYIPLGKPFTITKVVPDRSIIREINDRPAINIYRHYLEEKYPLFMKNRLFSMYPLGINSEGKLKLVTVTDCLGDGSLVCVGDIKENDWGHLMLLDSSFEFENLVHKLQGLGNVENSLIFVVNSLSRKKILKNTSGNELLTLQKTLGENAKIIGLYSDYCLAPHEEKGFINMEAGDVLITLWQ